MLDQVSSENRVGKHLARADRSDLHALIERQRALFSLHSLQADFYTSPEIYDLDVSAILSRHWHCAGHVSSIAKPGEYIVFEYDRDSVIIARGSDGEVRAFANVCRHRGSRICDKSGKAEGGVIICPYHAWSYSLDGQLAHARMMPRNFDKPGHSLKPVPMRVVEGLILVSFSDDPLGFDDCAENMTAILGPYGWSKAKVVHQSSMTFDADWKLALENQVECYHCAPSHPDFSVVHGQATGDEKRLTAEMNARAEAQGIDFKPRDHWALKALPGQEQAYSERYPMTKGTCTASRDGTPIAPLMGSFTGYDNGMTVCYVGPLNHFLCYGDYGAIFRYTPRGVNKTELAVTWLVDENAVQGRDYDLDQLTWLWKVTAAADKKIVEENQLGVASRFYQPGPYALPIEEKTVRFTEWYLDALDAAVAERSA